MGWLAHLRYPVAIIGTAIVLAVAWVVSAAGHKIIASHRHNAKQHYRRRRLLNTVVIILAVVAIGALWSKFIPRKGTFFGLIGAGLAVALREPLLSIAGRIAIFAGGIYTAGDRIEINKMTGDVIDVGFFYTRMMEVGNWIGGDQFSGRIVQFANAQIFGTPVFNYTRDFGYIWDEIQLPVTYASNVPEATRIMKEIGSEYTQEFLKGAEKQMQRMQHYFMVPRFDLDPQVYAKVTSNWIELTMRYVVEPQKRRAASSYIYSRLFEAVQARDDIAIASSTMDITVQQAAKPAKEKSDTAEKGGRAA
jgi:small-conductance mechanosensitive channel